MRAAIYARLSISTDESVSIDRQLESCRAEAESRGWVVVLEATDDGVSASRTRPDQRPGWRTISSRYADIDAVLYWRTDRLARRVLDFYNLADETQKNGVALVSATEPQLDLSTGQGRAFAGMLAIFAEMEADAISARGRAARSYVIKQGRVPGGARPWPFEVVDNEDGPGKVWRPVPERARLLRNTAERIYDGGASVASVAREWTEKGIPNKQGEVVRWTPTAVDRLLRNPTIYGARVHHGELVRNGDGTIRVDQEQAIISRTEFQRLQDALDARSLRRDSPEQPKALLAGLAECGSCGATMSTHRPSKRPAAASYRCQSPTCDAKASIVVAHLDEHVIDWYLGAWSWVPERIAVTEARGGDTEEITAIQVALDDAQESLDATDSDEQALRLFQRRRELRTHLRQAQDAGAETVTRYVETGRSVSEAWYATEDHEERRRILAASVGAVVVEKGTRGAKTFDPSRVTVFGPDDVD